MTRSPLSRSQLSNGLDRTAAGRIHGADDVENVHRIMPTKQDCKETERQSGQIAARCGVKTRKLGPRRWLDSESYRAELLIHGRDKPGSGRATLPLHSLINR